MGFRVQLCRKRGRAVRNVSDVYFNKPTKDLLRLRSEKNRKIERIESGAAGYWVNRDLRELRQQVIWINAVLESRNCQVPFPEA